MHRLPILFSIALMATPFVVSAGFLDFLKPFFGGEQQFGASVIQTTQGGTSTSTTPTDNSILIGHASNKTYNVKTLTAGTNITFGETGNTFTINASGGGSGTETLQVLTVGGQKYLTPTTTNYNFLLRSTNGLITHASSTIGGALNLEGILSGLSTGTSTLSGGISVSSGGLASSKGLSITGGKIVSSGALDITSGATSTFTGGIYASDLRTNLPSCDSLDTDASGAIICGVDATGGGSGVPNLIYRTLSGTKFYTASSSASDNLAWHFNNGFVSSGASSTISDILNLTGGLSATYTGTSTFTGGLSIDSLNLNGNNKNIFVNGRNATSTIVLTAAGGTGENTHPAGGPTQTQSTTNLVNKWVLDFQTATHNQCAFWDVTMPDNWDGGHILASVGWTATSGTATNGVAWGIRALASADDDAIDTAPSATTTVTDALIATNDFHLTAQSAGFVPAGSPVGGNNVYFRVCRETDNAGDTMTTSARLLQVKLEYGKKAYSD